MRLRNGDHGYGAITKTLHWQDHGAPALGPAPVAGEPARRARDGGLSLLALQFVVPATGILLVVGSDDMVVVHIAAHVAFFLALAAHLGMVIGKKLVPRMLPWGRPRPTPGRH